MSEYEVELNSLQWFPIEGSILLIEEFEIIGGIIPFNNIIHSLLQLNEIEMNLGSNYDIQQQSRVTLVA